MIKIKFRVSSDPTFARETVPGVMQNGFHCYKPYGTFHLTDEKFIYLPANENFPTAQLLTIKHENDRERGMTLRALRPANGRSKEVRDICDIEDKLVIDVLIGHSRAHTRQKMMPAFRQWSATFQGVEDGRAIIATCESITECPKDMGGSYVTLNCDGRHAEATALMKRLLVAFVGAREVHEVTEEFDAMLRRLESDFPWTYKRKRVKK